MANNSIVTCVCGQKNRVPKLGPTSRAICGKCKAALLTGNDPTWAPNPDFTMPADDLEDGDDDE
jgi:hypothetical protein